MIRSKYSALLGMIISFVLFLGLDRWLADQARIARDLPITNPMRYG